MASLMLNPLTCLCNSNKSSELSSTSTAESLRLFQVAPAVSSSRFNLKKKKSNKFSASLVGVCNAVSVKQSQTEIEGLNITEDVTQENLLN